MFYKKAVLIERGRFRPVTHVNLDMLDAALAEFRGEPTTWRASEVAPVMEITMRNLMTDGEIDLQRLHQPRGSAVHDRATR